MKRGSIELSMNVVVMLILSILLLVLGITFGSKVLNKGKSISDKAIDDLEKGLTDIMCADNQLICLQPARSEVKIGDGKVLTLRIINIYDESNFKLDVELVNAYADINTPLFEDINQVKNDIDQNWPHYTKSEFVIPANSPLQKVIYLNPTSKINDATTTPSGIYLFSVRVYREVNGEWQQYGNSMSFSANVI